MRTCYCGHAEDEHAAPTGGRGPFRFFVCQIDGCDCGDFEADPEVAVG